MIGWLLKHIFLNKQGRAAFAARQRAKRARDASPPPDDRVATSDGRARLKQDALAAFRQRRAEFESLDTEMQHRVRAAAERALEGKSGGRT